MATATIRPNYWTAPWDCPHNEVAFTATETWCETCGSDIDTLSRCEHGFSSRCPVSDSYSCGVES